MANNKVKIFQDTMQGIPQLGNNWGDLTTMLDAVLANGFNSKVADSVTSTGGVATVTISAGHLYLVDQWVVVSGANETEYNGEVQVLSTTAAAFTYAITGTPAALATGTVTVKVAPLGFSIAFTGTNKRAYRSNNISSNRPFLRVDNACDPLYTTTYAKKGKVTMCENMSDIDTVVGAQAPFDNAVPTKNRTATGSGTGVFDGWYKWYYARTEGNSSDVTAPSAFNRKFYIVGDDRGFYFLPEFNGINGKACYLFTDFISYRSGDGYNTWLSASDWWQAASTPGSTVNPSRLHGPDWANRPMCTLDFLGSICMRDHTQTGGNVRLGVMSLNTNNSQTFSGNSTGVPWPNATDYGMVLHPCYLRQEDGNVRGKIPGMFWILNNNALNEGDVFTGVDGYPGRKFVVLKSAYCTTAYVGQMSVAFDLTGPWW